MGGGAHAVPAADGSAPTPLLSLDVNGATLGSFGDVDGVVGPALPLVDLLHANLEEVGGVHTHTSNLTLVAHASRAPDLLRALPAGPP